MSIFDHELLADGHAHRGAHFTRDGGSRRLILVPRGFAGPVDLGGYSASAFWPAATALDARRWLAQKDRPVREGEPSEWAADVRTRAATVEEVAAVEALAAAVPA